MMIRVEVVAKHRWVPGHWMPCVVPVNLVTPICAMANVAAVVVVKENQQVSL
jgi:hypothetical protein